MGNCYLFLLFIVHLLCAKPCARHLGGDKHTGEYMTWFQVMGNEVLLVAMSIPCVSPVLMIRK